MRAKINDYRRKQEPEIIKNTKYEYSLRTAVILTTGYRGINKCQLVKLLVA